MNVYITHSVNLIKVKPYADNFSIFHQNIASLGLHFDELLTLLTTSNVEFDGIAIIEIGIKNKNNPGLNLDGYEHFNCKTHSTKGGVRVYISQK